MMYRFGKICLYTIVSLLISTIVHFGNGEFINAFMNNIIPLLATLSAIYMTANSLVVIEFNKIKEQHKSADGAPLMKEIKKIFITQMILIFVLLIIILSGDLIVNIDDAFPYYTDVIPFVVHASAIAVFCYFLEAIYDMGCTLFMLVDANLNKDK